MNSKGKTWHFSLAAAFALTCVIAKAETPLPESLPSLQQLRIAEDSDRRLVIVDLTGATVIANDKVLPRIENEYSPDSYDGYIADLLVESMGTSTTIDLQGERYALLSPSTQAGEYLFLITQEEGNTAYNFNLKFKHDGAQNSLSLTQILLNENNTECDQSLLSSYAIERKSLGINSIVDFDGTRAFDALKQLRLEFQTGATTAEKLMPKAVSREFDNALRAYAAGDEKQLKSVLSYFLAGDDEGTCDPTSYIIGKYYFPQKVGWSNDLGFLFEQAGYYPEAIELLKHITLKHPDRVVAYLNLADAYWALAKRAQAQEAYRQYYERMVAAQKQSKIPHRVAARM